MPNIYEEITEQHQQAYAAFEANDGREHPAPKPPNWWAGLPVIAGPFIVIAISGLMLSSLRTGPVFYESALSLVGVTLATSEAVLAVLTIELFFVVARFFIILNRYHRTNVIDDVETWTRRGFWLAFSVALSANLFATIKDLDFIQDHSPVISFVVQSINGASVPILAFISGDILGVFWVTTEKRRKELWEDFNLRLDVWKQARDRRWNSQKNKRYGVHDRLDTARTRLSTGVHMDMDSGQTAIVSTSTGHGFGRNDNARQLVRDWLDTHSGDEKLKTRQLAEKMTLAGQPVSKSTVGNVYAERGIKNG